MDVTGHFFQSIHPTLQLAQPLAYVMQENDDGFPLALTDAHRIAARTRAIGWG